MLYIYSKDKEVLGTPMVADNLEEAKQRILVRQKERFEHGEEAYEAALETRTHELKQMIKATEDIIAMRDGEEVDEETEATAVEAEAKKAEIELQIVDVTAEIRAEVDKFIEAWVFDVEDLEIYEIKACN